MAKVSAKNAIITLKDSAGTARNVSADISQFDIQYAVDPLEVTGFTEQSHNFIPGLPVVGVTLTPYWNQAATTGFMTVALGIVGATTSKTLTIQPEGTGLTLTGEFMCDGVPVGGSPNTDLKMGSVHFSVMGAVKPTFA